VKGIYAGMHVVFVPPPVLTVHPLAWVHMVTKVKATTVVVNSRALILACGKPAKEYKDDSFATLRMMLVADGASPWSLHACDTFLEVFKPKGMSKEVVCPCASSAETLTIGLRRYSYWDGVLLKKRNDRVTDRQTDRHGQPYMLDR
jgi:hypothetical protein